MDVLLAAICWLLLLGTRWSGPGCGYWELLTQGFLGCVCVVLVESFGTSRSRSLRSMGSSGLDRVLSRLTLVALLDGFSQLKSTTTLYYGSFPGRG